MAILAAAAPAAAGTAAATTAAAAAGTATSLFTAANVSMALTGLSAVSSIRQGQAAAVSGKVQADQIKQDAINKEINRRSRLVASLASQNATRAASGIAYLEGSSKVAALQDIKAGERGNIVDRAGSGAAATSAISEGRIRRTGSVIGAGASLLDQANRIADRG